MDEQFELIIDVQTKGIRATEREIASATNALDNLNREGKVTPEVFDHLSRSLVAQNNKLKTGAAQWRNYANSIKAARDIQRGTLASGLKGIQGTGSFLGGAQAKSMQDEFRAIQATSDARKKASDEAVAGIARMEAATGRGAEAERRLNSERARGFQTSNQLMGAWDKEFNALTRSTGAKRTNLAESNALRYANYDLANTLLGTAAALTAVGVASVASFASQESAFTEVERIAGGSADQVKELRNELQTLSTEIPRSFQNLSGIASLGGALNIPAEDLEAFTRTVATLSAVTKVTEETVAMAFGRLAQYLKVPKEQFDSLGSAILRAGNVSVASEEQVIKFTQALAPAADRVKFTTEQTVALGAAIASYGNINVEGAGGALTRITNIIERAVGEGGTALENFAAVSGKSADEFRASWSTDASSTFNAMLGGLSTVENLTAALDALGFSNTRDRRIIEGLTQNYGEFNRILAETTVSFQRGTYMNESYALVLDDLSTKWTTFLNAVMNAAAAVATSFAPAIKTALDVSQGLVVAFTDFANSGVGEFWIRMAAGALAVVAAWAALRGAIALASATTQAFLFANAALNGGGLAKGVLNLAAAWGVYTPAVGDAARGTWSLRGAILALGKATVIIGVIQAISQAFFDLGGTVEWVGQRFVDWANFLNTLSGGSGAFNAQKEWAEGIIGWSKTLPRAGSDLKGLNDKVRRGDDGMQAYLNSLNEGTDAVEDFGSGVAGASDKVRTLTDYASDLSSVWSRAFEIRFSGQNTLDTITSSFISLRDAAEQSRLRMMGLRAEIQVLASNINIQETFLKVALDYGDTTRAQAIEAELAKLRADLANKTADLNKEQESQNKTLTGNSAAAIANRKTITDLVTQYQAHIQALAASGLSTDELKRQTDLLQADFIAQATQLGFNQQELGLYSLAFQDVTTAINNVPRDITVTFNADPAIQALNEFAARAAQIGQQAGDAFGAGLSGGAEQGAIDAQQRVTEVINQAYSGILAFANSFGGSTGRSGAGRGGGGGGGGGFAGGGYTGRGGMYEPAGIVHRGEYVIPKRYVNQSTGLPYSDALGRYQRGATGRTSYAGGGYVTGSRGGRGVMDISATSLQQLAMLIDKVIAVDGKVIGETASRSYQTGTATGRN